jgi:hypothetical protein
MSAKEFTPAVSVDLTWLEPADRRQLSHALVRGQITASVNFAAYPPSRGVEDTVRADLQAVQLALDLDQADVELGPWHEDPETGWRQLTELLRTLDHLSSAEGLLVEQLRTRVLTATAWQPPQPVPQRTRTRALLR